MTKEEIKNIYNEYLIQSSSVNHNLFSFHDNGHDNSGGHPDYHNDSHDNTPGFYNVQIQENDSDYLKKRLELLKIYLLQSSKRYQNEKGFHDNGHDNSGGHPDYHNDSHDNTPGMRQLVLTKHATN